MRAVRKDILNNIPSFGLIKKVLGEEEGARIYNRWYHTSHDELFWNVSFIVNRWISANG